MKNIKSKKSCRNIAHIQIDNVQLIQPQIKHPQNGDWEQNNTLTLIMYTAIKSVLNSE